MKKITILSVIIATVLILVSCDGMTKFISASSAANEVLVVMDDNLWEGEAGRALYDVLNSPVKGLPQREPNFKILHITPENFTSTFKMARNIIIPNISNVYSQTKISSEIDKYAMGQVIMTINAPDSTSFSTFVAQNESVIVDYFITKELERNGKWLISELGAPRSRVQQVFEIDIYIPKGVTNVTEATDFYWATNNAGRGRQDVVIYQFPYTSETIFEKDSLIALRDKVLGKHIKGSFDSKMTTATRVYNPDYRKIEIDNHFRAELSGLWEMSTDMMGGPFVMHAFVNEQTNKVVVVETYIYAPETNKRNLMRNLEATLYTISITDTKKK